MLTKTKIFFIYFIYDEMNGTVIYRYYGHNRKNRMHLPSIIEIKI